MLRQAQHERREYLSAAFTAEPDEASARTERVSEPFDKLRMNSAFTAAKSDDFVRRSF